MHRFKVKRGDITKENVDAIVNAANEALQGGSGVDGMVHEAAGPKLLRACQNIGGCPTGTAVITPGFNLHAKYIIHTAGPVWRGGHLREEALLASCYRSSLQVAVDNGIKTIAFSSISTGAYSYPLRGAARVAIKAIAEFLATDDQLEAVTMVCFGRETTGIYESEIERYKEKHTREIG